jgi:hypothetical protein
MSDKMVVPAYVRHPRKKEEEYVAFDEIRNDPKLASEVIEAELRELVPAIRRVQSLEMALRNQDNLVSQVLTIMSGKAYPASWIKAEAIARSKQKKRAS